MVLHKNFKWSGDDAGDLTPIGVGDKQQSGCILMHTYKALNEFQLTGIMWRHLAYIQIYFLLHATLCTKHSY